MRFSLRDNSSPALSGGGGRVFEAGGALRGRTMFCEVQQSCVPPFPLRHSQSLVTPPPLRAGEEQWQRNCMAFAFSWACLYRREISEPFWGRRFPCPLKGS